MEKGLNSVARIPSHHIAAPIKSVDHSINKTSIFTIYRPNKLDNQLYHDFKSVDQYCNGMPLTPKRALHLETIPYQEDFVGDMWNGLSL